MEEDLDDLDEIFRRNGRRYDGSDKEVIDLFKWAIQQDDGEATAKALIYPGSPVVSDVIEMWRRSYGGRWNDPIDDSCLHLLPKVTTTYSSVIAERLIGFGLNVDTQNAEGETALHLSVEYHSTIDDTHTHMKLIKVLLENGASTNIRNKRGLSPIQLSLYLGKLEVAEELLKEEDKLPNAIEVDRTERRRHLVKCLLQKKRYSYVCNSKYSILLHFLVLENDEETFEYVANNTEFDANAVNCKRTMLLQLVAEKGTIRMIKALINVGAHPNVVGRDFAGTHPLDIAIKKAQIENFHCLLDCGASVNKVDRYIRGANVPPLHYAVCAQSLEMVEKLVKLGADVNALGHELSPLQLACGSTYSKTWYQNYFTELISTYYNKADNIKIVEVLLDHGADIEMKDASRRRTSLDVACSYGKLDIVKLLLSRGAKIDQGNHSSTLQYAVDRNNVAVVKLILEKGVNVNSRIYKSCFTPLKHAFAFLHVIERRNFANDIREIFAALTVFLLIEKKESIIEKTLTPFKEGPIYKEFVNEFNLMKSNICESRNFSFFNILTEDVEYVGRLLKHEDIRQVLNSGEYKKNFPIYGACLEDRIQEATIRERKIDLAIALFKKHVNNHILHELIRVNIFQFLDLDDLKHFAEACFVDIESI